MEKDIVLQQVSKIDGTYESIIGALEAVGGYLKEHDGKLPYMVEENLSQGIWKCILEWTANGDNEAIEMLLNQFMSFIKTEDELMYPFRALNSRQKIGARIKFYAETLNTYLRSDLKMKFYPTILFGGHKQDMRREILKFLFLENRAVKLEEIAAAVADQHYTHEDLVAGLKELEEIIFVRSFEMDGITVFTTTPRARNFKEKILSMQRKPAAVLVQEAYADILNEDITMDAVQEKPVGAQISENSQDALEKQKNVYRPQKTAHLGTFPDSQSSANTWEIIIKLGDSYPFMVTPFKKITSHLIEHATQANDYAEFGQNMEN